MATCKPKNQKYPITDAIAKAVIIDLPTSGLIFASLGTMTPLVITYATLAYTGGAAAGNIIREYAREYGFQYPGGVIGGATKYFSRSVMINDYEKLDLKAVLGGVNNLAYEICKDDCPKDIASSFYFSATVEGAESFTKAYALTDNILKGTAIGVMAGLVGSSFANFVYAPNIENIHELVDSFYGYSSEFCPA